VIISHLHSDHFDPAAEARLPKELSILCQPCDAQALRDKGFVDVTAVAEQVIWGGITITRTPCQHGSGAVLGEMGEASGFVLHAAGEPTLYWAGDTVWCDAVAAVLAREQPEVVVVHASGATWGEGTLIVMDAEQTLRVCQAGSTVIATHLEAYDHGTVTRAALRARAEAEGISAERLLIPKDGQICSFS
jgi:L-ascorbate metabolism protein UlaG (beta-lactamase superfamily)